MLPGKVYTPDEVLRILWRRRWLLLVPPAVVGCVAALYSLSLPDRFKSETSILVVPQRVPEAYVKSTVTGRIEDRLQSISQQILSRTRLERIILDFDLYPKHRAVAPMEDVVERMRGDITVQVVKGDSFRVSYVGDGPRIAMRVTERLASLFIEENLRDREVLAEGTNQFLEAQLEDARRRLIEQEKKVEAYKLRNAGELPTQLTSNLQVLQNIQLQIQSIVDSLARDRDRRLAIERALGDLALFESQAPVPPLPPPAAPTVDPNGGLSGTTEQQLEGARQLLGQLETRLKPEHPDVVRMRRTVRDLAQKLEAESLQAPLSLPDPAASAPSAFAIARQKRETELKAEVRSLEQSIAVKEVEEKALRQRAQDYQARVEAAPVRETEMTELTRDYGTIQTLYGSLLTKREDSRMAANLERRQIGEQFKLLDPARAPARPFTPDRMRIAVVGVIAGLVLAALAIGLLEYLDKTMRRDEEVMSAVGLPVLVTIPLMPSRRERQHELFLGVVTNVALTTLVFACAGVVGWTVLRAARII